VCGAVIDDETAHYNLVPDSSVIHRVDPRFDGQRFVVTCSTDSFVSGVDTEGAFSVIMGA